MASRITDCSVTEGFSLLLFPNRRQHDAEKLRETGDLENNPVQDGCCMLEYRAPSGLDVTIR